MKKIIILTVLVSLCSITRAQTIVPYNQNASYEQYMAYQQQSAQASKAERNKTKVFTGFSGGVIIHGGYAFSKNPQELFRNGTLEQTKNLPSSGLTLGIGGALRFHLFDHMHIGGEGHVSTMPLQSTGSNVRSGWGGALIDAYTTWGKVQPLIGIVIGGGTMKRLYVPDADIEAHTADDPQTVYNASSTRSSFFLLDPYIGLEIALGQAFHLMIRVDYALQFGKSKSLWDQNLSMSNFLTPSGPRLYLGFIFNHDRK